MLLKNRLLLGWLTLLLTSIAAGHCVELRDTIGREVWYNGKPHEVRRCIEKDGTGNDHICICIIDEIRANGPPGAKGIKAVKGPILKVISSSRGPEGGGGPSNVVEMTCSDPSSPPPYPN